MRWGARLILTILAVIVSNTHAFALVDTVQAHPVVLSAQERAWIARHPVLRVGVLNNWAPFTYRDRNDNLVGIDVDLLNAIAQRTGLHFQLVPFKSWESMASNWNNLDVVSSVAQSPVREKVAEFTHEYSTVPIVIIQRESEETFGPTAVLAGKTLALPRRHIITQTVTNRLPPSAVVLTETQEDCFKLVGAKKADATFANLYVASQYLNNHPEMKLDISGVVAKSDLPLRMAVHRQPDFDGQAVAILNKGLASVSQSELDTIVSKHLALGLQSRQRVLLLRKRGNQILLALAAGALLLLCWNYFMQKEIRARRAVEAQLREANESMEIFSHSLSHDLRAPLRGITGFARALKEDYSEKLDHDGQEYVEHILSSGSRMDHLITDVLAYSRTNNTHWPMEHIDLGSLVHELVESFPPEQRPCFEVQSPLPSVKGHATLLTQALENLLSNAVKFVPSDRTAAVTIRAAADDGVVTIFVEDNGIGIDPKDQQRIFKIFERAAPSPYKGTGVGLAVVAKAIERMGGNVGVESNAGQGSRFWIKLPAADAPQPSRRTNRSHEFWNLFDRARER